MLPLCDVGRDSGQNEMLTTLERGFKPELCILKTIQRPKMAHVRLNKTYEGVFNILGHHGNGNWKYITILSQSLIMGVIKKINNKCWRGWGQEGQWHTSGVNGNDSFHYESQYGGSSLKWRRTTCGPAPFHLERILRNLSRCTTEIPAHPCLLPQ